MFAKLVGKAVESWKKTKAVLLIELAYLGSIFDCLCNSDQRFHSLALVPAHLGWPRGRKNLNVPRNTGTDRKVMGAELAPSWHTLWKKHADESYECKLEGKVKL